MGGITPLVQGAGPAATRNVNMRGYSASPAGHRKISPISLLRHFRPLESRPGGGCRMDARIVADEFAIGIRTVLGAGRGIFEMIFSAGLGHPCAFNP